jgi:hypothetical protein
MNIMASLPATSSFSNCFVNTFIIILYITTAILKRNLLFLYCNVLGVIYSRWNFITLKIQYAIVNHSPQRFQNSNTRTTSTSFLIQLLIAISRAPNTIDASYIFQPNSNSCSLKLPNTSRDNPSSGYQSSCTPQRNFGVYSIIKLQFNSPDDRLPSSPLADQV